MTEKFYYAVLYMDDCDLALDLVKDEDLEGYPEQVLEFINSMVASLEIDCEK